MKSLNSKVVSVNYNVIPVISINFKMISLNSKVISVNYKVISVESVNSRRYHLITK